MYGAGVERGRSFKSQVKILTTVFTKLNYQKNFADFAPLRENKCISRKGREDYISQMFKTKKTAHKNLSKPTKDTPKSSTENQSRKNLLR